MDKGKVVYFTAGVLIGASIGAVAAKAYLGKKADEEVLVIRERIERSLTDRTKELLEVRKELHELEKTIDKKEDDDEHTQKVVPSDKPKGSILDYKEALDSYSGREDPEGVSGGSGEVDGDAEEEFEPTSGIHGKDDGEHQLPGHSEDPVEGTATVDPDLPHIISDQDFFNDDTYDHVEMTYYEDDDILVDDSEMIVDDEHRLVGSALDNFGAMSNDKDMVYVRNKSYSSDYEITRIHGSYQEYVLGVEPPSEPTIRKMRSADD